MARLLTLLADHSADYLIRQIEAGADAVQIFDSWAGVLDEASFERMLRRAGAPRSSARCGQRYPDVPIIGFPRGAGSALRRTTGSEPASRRSGSTGRVPLAQAARLQADGAVQGNLDPLRLVAGGEALADGVDAILRALGDGPLVFNLGHGITPETPIEHVEAMIARVQERAGDERRRHRQASGGATAMMRMAIALAIFAVLTAAAVSGSIRDNFYLWAKAIHVIAVISWMAGMLYLPRLFVYHAEAEPGSPQSETFKVMERRLLRGDHQSGDDGHLGRSASGSPGRVLAFSGGWLHAKIGARPC